MKRNRAAIRREDAAREKAAGDKREAGEPEKAPAAGRRRGGGNWAFIRFLLGNR